jgi:hypothetical protein
MIRAFKDVRVRLRDAAAAAHAAANATSEQAAAHVHDQHEALDDALDAAVSMLSEARTVHELSRIAAATGVERLALAEAIEDHTRTLLVTEASAAHLRTEVRKLRTIEKLGEHVDRQIARTDARNEQRNADDIAARRR